MTRDERNGALGTQDLESGLRPSRHTSFLVIAVNAMLVLAICNAQGLKSWAERLPSSSLSVALLDVATGLEDLTKVSPYEWGARVRRIFAVGRQE